MKKTQYFEVNLIIFEYMANDRGIDIRKLALYLSISILATLVDFSIFVFLLRFIGWHYLFSNVISRSFGIVIKFSLNKLLTFKERKILAWKNQFFRFLLVSGSAFLVSMVILFVAVEFLKLPEIYAKVFEIGFVFIYTFILHNAYSFN